MRDALLYSPEPVLGKGPPRSRHRRAARAVAGRHGTHVGRSETAPALSQATSLHRTAAARTLVSDLRYGPTRGFLWKIVPLPDDRWVVSNGVGVWLLDTQERCAPLHLPGSPNPVEIHVTPDGRKLVEVGVDKTVRVWEQRREMSVLGAYALVESWAIYAATMALAVGMVISAGRAQSRELGRALPTEMWVACVMLAIAIAWRSGDRIVGYAVDYLYEDTYKGAPAWRMILDWALSALLFAGVLGLMRLRRWW